MTRDEKAKRLKDLVDLYNALTVAAQTNADFTKARERASAEAIQAARDYEAPSADDGG